MHYETLLNYHYLSIVLVLGVPIVGIGLFIYTIHYDDQYTVIHIHLGISNLLKREEENIFTIHRYLSIYVRFLSPHISILVNFLLPIYIVCYFFEFV